MGKKDRAMRILNVWKGDSYRFGLDVLDSVGEITKKFGEETLIIRSDSEWSKEPMKKISNSLEEENIDYRMITGARPNCPREDLYKMSMNIAQYEPDSLVILGGGSKIDGGKAANVLATYRPDEAAEALTLDWNEADSIDPYFGTGNVTKVKESTGKKMIPMIAVQTASGSGAHLTKYSNITDPVKSQKKLIVDDAIIPEKAIFDYGLTMEAPRSLTLDGALDGISHLWEVFMGAKNNPNYDKIKEVTELGFDLIVNNLHQALEDDEDARLALGLGTDLGAYAIMLGGTNGPHLGSFSLVDKLSHGRACAILLPYYTVFFSENIEDQLRTIGPLFKESGFIQTNLEDLEGRELGEAVARGMIKFNQSLNFPTSLKEAEVSTDRIKRMVEAAKDPQLKMKVLNMPIPINPGKGDVDKYMKSILEAAYKGDLDHIEAKETGQ
ncbi:hypothetical protein AKJ57_02500 [candidate division MSBL1 archaeon SCGC-AAA259A05]|uniref:Uncharacterized protein n=1 Tax=candidate division MSBL1 archaeon SCGC-AAA259A05 TaxID=1698259 RepID=A0A133UA40_9EURY|nr:hypothetical protein AKJ57_02500 [candidate division MSBL1 archaeon SCGC-AAA259A05]